MQKPILNHIKCLNCGAGSFNAANASADAKEIRSADIICASCNEKYEVKDGIISMLLHDETIKKEQAGWVSALDKSKNPEEWTDSFILRLPNVEDPSLQIKPENLAAWIKQADNFYGVLKNISDFKDKLVLDIGAGRCWSTAEFARRGAKCVAYDILPDKYLGLASSDIFFQHENIYFERVIGSMTNIPFADNTFDIVFSNCSLHHTTDLELTFREISRVLKPGGIIAVSNEPVKGLFRNKEASQDEIEAGINENVFTIRQWLRAINNSGLYGRVLFPASVAAVIEKRRKLGGSALKRAAINTINFFWKIPSFRLFADIAVRPILHYFMGMGLNFVGKKMR